MKHSVVNLMVKRSTSITCWR